MTFRSGLKATTAMLAVLSVAALQGCGGGTTKKADPGGSGNVPTFDDCIAQVTPIAADKIQTADAILGAQYYDNMFDRIFVTEGPAETHPLWPATQPSKAGGETWRCKNCHGWDYKGSEGAYGDPNSDNYTGIEGILGHVEENRSNPADLYCVIRAGNASVGADHSQVEALIAEGARTGITVDADQAMWDLTAFLIQGVIDTTPYIAPNGGIIGGDPTNGKALYPSSCGGVTCHTSDGSKFADDVGLGAIAGENPWEFLHKARFGDPHDQRMPAFESLLSIEEILNIATYAQDALAGKTGIIEPDGGGGGGGGVVSPTNALVLRGGLLYDNHFATTGNTAGTLPNEVNPMWVLRQADPVSGVQNPRAGQDSWRCKECHGWDYKGSDGNYGPGNSHYTGFPGLLDRLPGLTTANLKSYLMNGVSGTDTLGQPIRRHKFGPGSVPNLASGDIDALVAFLLGTAADRSDAGVIDTSQYILEGPLAGGVKNADSVRGGTLYAGGAPSPNLSCANVACHGINGRTQNFGTVQAPEYLDDLAVGNPWEVLHKARFGQPGTPQMTPVLTWGKTQDAADILKYSQDVLPTLP